MLTELQLEDWKSFGAGPGARNVLKLSPMTLLVGPNGSGKSNVLEALRFLQGSAQGLPLSDVLRGRTEGSRVVWQGIRGHIAEAARLGTSSFTIHCNVNFPKSVQSYEVELKIDSDALVSKECLWEDWESPWGPSKPSNWQRLLFDTHWRRQGNRRHSRISERPAISARLGNTEGQSRSLLFDAGRSVLGQLHAEQATSTYVNSRIEMLHNFFADMSFLDIVPSLMRDYRPDTGGTLGTSGENISAVLSSLNPSQLQDIVDWLSELCAPPLESIDFDRTQLREVMMFLIETGGRRISARSASDGTLRFLGLLVGLFACRPGSTIILEEPDVGLHPSRIRLLAELLEKTAARRHVQIIATTHCPTLLAHLSKETLGQVISFGRDPSTGFSVCSTLQELPWFATLRDAEDLEHLISTGWLERAL